MIKLQDEMRRMYPAMCKEARETNDKTLIYQFRSLGLGVGCVPTTFLPTWPQMVAMQKFLARMEEADQKNGATPPLLLDVFAGNGYRAAAIASQGIRVYASDNSKSQLMRNRGEKDFFKVAHDVSPLKVVEAKRHKRNLVLGLFYPGLQDQDQTVKALQKFYAYGHKTVFVAGTEKGDVGSPEMWRFLEANFDLQQTKYSFTIHFLLDITEWSKHTPLSIYTRKPPIRPLAPTPVTPTTN